jgi:PIN domain nuclease of toxin-antitoxin system
MHGVFLDTHVLIWYLSRPESLTSEEMHAIDSTVQRGSSLKKYEMRACM